MSVSPIDWSFPHGQTRNPSPQFSWTFRWAETRQCLVAISLKLRYRGQEEAARKQDNWSFVMQLLPVELMIEV